MQTQADPTMETLADKRITSAERNFKIYLDVDWNGDGSYSHRLGQLQNYVSDVSVDKSLAGSMPAELTVLEGASAAELTFTISGFDYDSKLSFDAVFSPYRASSPFWGMDLEGCEVNFWVGIETALGVAWYPQFWGNIRTIQPDRADGTVVITALDRSEKLRGPVSFPAWAVSDLQAAQGQFYSQLTDSSWVIDHCLRLADVSPTPYRPFQRTDLGLADDDVTGPQIWINGTGSLVPTIGWFNNSIVQQFAPDTEPAMYSFDGAVHPDSPEPTTRTQALSGRGLAGNKINSYFAADRDRMSSLGCQITGFTLVTSNPGYKTVADYAAITVRAADRKVISIHIANGKVWSVYLDELTSTSVSSPQLTIPTDQNDVRIFAIWDYYNPAGATVYIKAGTVDNAGNTVVGGVKAYASADDQIKGSMDVNRTLSIQDIHYTSTNFGSLATPGQDRFAGYDAKYAAVLDPGLNRISFMPTRSGDDAWSTITDIASAEFGSVFWDEGGVLRFWNYDRLLAKQSEIVRTLSLDDVSGLSITRSLDSVRNIWTVTTARERGRWAVCIEGQDINQFVVPPASTVEFRIWQDDVQIPDPGGLPRCSTSSGAFPAWSDAIIHAYVVQFLEAPGWQENDARSSGVDVRSYLDLDGNVIVSVHNGYEVYARLATGSITDTANNNNQPALRVRGTQIYSLDAVASTTTNTVSRAKYGPQNLALSGDWYQDAYNANGMVDKLLERTSSPVAVTDAITIAGDPRIQLGDTLRIVDEDGFGSAFDVQVYGIKREYSLDDGLVDTLTVQLIPPGSYWDDPEYGLWDLSFVWSE